jgi:two-component system sensor histidine kinase CpxA
MYSLFWNIFVSFWIAMIISGFTIAWYTEKLSEDEVPPLFKQHYQIFKQQSEAAQQALSRAGIPGLLQWKADKQNIHAIERIYIVDEQRVEITHQPLPQDITKFINSEFSIHFNTSFDSSMDSILGFRVTAPDSKQYYLVTTFNKPHPLSYLLTPQRIIIGIVVSGLICFALARYLSSPIKRLRQVATQLSQGNLDARLSDATQNRNDEIGELAKDFNVMASRLQAIITSQKHLMRDISHELRSPLARIQVALELARKQETAAIDPELQRIELELERLNTLIDELLTFVRMEIDKETLDKVIVNIKDLLEQIVEDTRFENSQISRQQQVSINCPANLEISANPQLLYRAFENIIRNACFYAPKDTKVTIKCVASAHNILLTIEDEGPGVPEEMLEKIFEPFVRVSKSREKQSGGYGIGLAMTKRAIEIHGGQIQAKNKISGTGMAMDISLPNCPIASENL